MSVKYSIHKGLSILIAFILIFSFALPAFATGETTITVGSASANAGDTEVTIPVSITNCPSFVAFVWEVTYNTQALNLTSISKVEGLGGTLTTNLESGRIVFEWDEAAFPDGEIFVLKFSVNASSGTGNYPIHVDLVSLADGGGWSNEACEDITATFIPGVISVTGTGDRVASYDGREYESVNLAIAAAAASGSPGTITMINDTTIADYDDRIIIPAGADITLDMNGHTITSEVPATEYTHTWVVEVQKDGALNLVDNSEAKGGRFNHSTGAKNTCFLANSGTLNMSNIDIINFYNGIRDGSWYTSMGGSAGTYGTISNCKLEVLGTAMSFRHANVDAITGCTIITQLYGIDIGQFEDERGKISLLEDCTITVADEAGHSAVSIFGTIETIKDCTITSMNGWVVGNYGGTIGKITSTSADKHTTISGFVPVYNGGTITLIESDHTLFYRSSESEDGGDCLWNDKYFDSYGFIGTISGGTFDSDYRAIYVEEGTSIGTISGGTFKSGKYAAVQMNGGTIDSITGGVFIGGLERSALYLSKEGASIGSITGGYYKSQDDHELIYAVDGATINIPEGYGFSTVPTTINEEGGFYRLGKTVNITWKIEDEQKTDILIVGDPVVYRGDEPTKTGYIFAGWSDGEILYRPAQMLPASTEDVTYTAVFNEIGSEEDYTVSLATTAENVNAGEEFTVDVNITSNGNNSFYGATIEVTYDNSKVTYDSASSICATNFGITSSTSGNTSTLKIVGAAQSGYAMTDHAYTVATLGFKAKSDVTTGSAIFGIEDEPVVDQQYAVHSQFVNRGDDISVNLWNLTVTFKAGINVNMATATAHVKYNAAGLYTDTTYATPFTEPAPAAADHYTLDDPVWYPGNGSNVSYSTISATAFTDNAVYIATASPSGFAVTLPEGVTVISGITDDKATYLTDIVFTVNEVPGYLNVVTYTVGDGEPVTLTADAEAKYTIPGSTILGSITVDVEHVVHGTVTFIPNDDFKSLPAGHKVLVLTVNDKLSAGAYEYDGNAMFYSDEYSTAGNQVYLYVVPNEVTSEGALAKLQINKAAVPCIELAYNGDVNLDNKRNSTDAVLTYALYGGLWTDDVFTKVSMRMRLEADVNGDKVVDTADAQKILNNIWGQ